MSCASGARASRVGTGRDLRRSFLAASATVVLVAACTGRTSSPTVPPLGQSAPPPPSAASAPPQPASPSPAVSPPVTPTTSFQPGALAFRGAQHGLLGGGFLSQDESGPGIVLATADGGATWQVRALVAAPPAPRVGSLPYGGYIRGIAVARDGTAWLWGDRMAPLASTDEGATWRPRTWAARRYSISSQGA